MKKGVVVNYTTPNSSKTYRGKILSRVSTHNGDWFEVAPVDENDKVIKGAATLRIRPARCSE